MNARQMFYWLCSSSSSGWPRPYMTRSGMSFMRPWMKILKKWWKNISGSCLFNKNNHQNYILDHRHFISISLKFSFYNKRKPIKWRVKKENYLSMEFIHQMMTFWFAMSSNNDCLSIFCACHPFFSHPLIESILSFRGAKNGCYHERNKSKRPTFCQKGLWYERKGTPFKQFATSLQRLQEARQILSGKRIGPKFNS